MLKYLDHRGGVPTNSIFFLWKIRAEFESGTHMYNLALGRKHVGDFLYAVRDEHTSGLLVEG